MIHLDVDQWLTVTKDDIPVHPPAHWDGVVELIRQDGRFGLKAMHNGSRIVLSAQKVLELTSAPVSLTVPMCPDCREEMVLRFGRYGSFFGCVQYPQCKHKTAVAELLNV